MESEFVAWLRARLPAHERLRLGPGDDAAVLRLGDRASCVVTVDLLTDGVDFHVGQASPRRIGHKSLAVNLSDLAAMAARPLAVVVALALPRHGGRELAEGLYEGMLPLAEQFDVVIAGGDTNSWDGPLVVSITAIGEVTSHGPLLRSGAKPGDQIVVTGAFGGSILGHHFDFTPRVDEALKLNERYDLHAGIDVSDGLSIDLSRLAKESGCGAVITESLIPIAPAAEQLAAQLNDRSTPLDHALGDGEDFELILAVAPPEAERMIAEQPIDAPLTRIGHFVETPGLWQIDPAGNQRPVTPRGWEHELN
ncbi:MAG: thiamine-phosphate kinase [Planctomycetes bacterium]|nr:thiamine-phosphate kinase [Planctomycetota bacterium]